MISRTPMTLLQLSARDYRRYLTPIRDLDHGFLTLAVNRLANPEGTTHV